MSCKTIAFVGDRNRPIDSIDPSDANRPLVGEHQSWEALKLTPSLRSMLERIERHSGTLLMLTVTASGGRGIRQANEVLA